MSDKYCQLENGEEEVEHNVDIWQDFLYTLWWRCWSATKYPSPVKCEPLDGEAGTEGKGCQKLGTQTRTFICPVWYYHKYFLCGTRYPPPPLVSAPEYTPKPGQLQMIDMITSGTRIYTNPSQTLD